MLEIRARLRELARMPGYVAAVLFSLSAGMAVCVAVFSIVNTLVFADVPGIARRTTLVRVAWSDGGRLSPADLEAFEERLVPSLGAVAAQADHAVAVGLPSGATIVPAAFVSPDFFVALGTQAVAGRLLAPTDADGGSAPAATISEAIWHSAFHGEPDAIGRTILVAGRAFTIVGITPEGFAGLDAADVGSHESDLPQVIVPLRFAMWPGTASRTGRFLSIAARLGDGVPLTNVRREIAVVGHRLAGDAPAPAATRSLRVFRMGLDLWDAPAESALVVLIYLFVPLGILAIGCGNVINLQMARAHERAAELSVRLALGASPGRLARLLTIDIVPMAIGAGLLGWAGARLLLASAASFVPVRFALDVRALVFTAVTVCAATIAGGLLPAWLAARDVVAAGLRAAHGGPLHTRLRYLLIIAQVGGSIALMTVVTLAARTLQAHAVAGPSDAQSILVAQVNLADANADNSRAAPFVRAILDTLAGDAAVRSAGFADFFLAGHSVRYRFESDGADVQRSALGGVVTPGWFEATGTTLMTGRLPATPFEAVVNDAFTARAGAPAAVTLGSRLRVSSNGAERRVEIVGVLNTVALDTNGRPAPTLLMTMPEIPPSSLVLTVRAADTSRARRAILAAAEQFDRTLPFARIETLDATLDEAFRGLRQMTMMAGALAAVALALASVGLYALMSYTVRRRTREIGIRIAVGAGPRQILTLVLRAGVTLVVIGGVLGLSLATPIAAVMRSTFVGLSPWSPSIGMPTLALLFVVAAAAALVPAWRALRIDPIAALRES